MTYLESEVFNAGIAGGMPNTVASLLVAQAKHESANFTSSVYRNNNNAFGYKYVGQSGAMKGTVSPEGDYYARYVSLYSSATEVVNWWKRRIKEGKVKSWQDISTPESYSLALKTCGYYGDSVSNYLAGLKRWFIEFGQVKDEGLAVLAVGLFVAALYYFKIF